MARRTGRAPDWSALSAVVLVGNRQSWSVHGRRGRPIFQVLGQQTQAPRERPKAVGRAPMTDAELADVKKRATARQDGGRRVLAADYSRRDRGKTKFSSSDTQVGK